MQLEYLIYTNFLSPYILNFTSSNILAAELVLTSKWGARIYGLCCNIMINLLLTT